MSTTPARRLLSSLLLAVLGLSAAAAEAGPGFIASSRVTTDDAGAEIRVRFNCKAHYVRHDPQSSGDTIRVYIEPTGICNGVAPSVAETRSRMRPFDSESIHLLELEYDGGISGASVLTLRFTQPVSFAFEMDPLSFDLVVRINGTVDVPVVAKSTLDPNISHRQVERSAAKTPAVGINLLSLQRAPTIADAPTVPVSASQRLYYVTKTIDGRTWYRLRLGDFADEETANQALVALAGEFPDAWIDTVHSSEEKVELERAMSAADVDSVVASPEIDKLMQDARNAMSAGETSRAVQIYTKILQFPAHPRQAEAQEYLGLTREKSGQLAHAKAEYQRYLDVYGDSEGASRVRQRLAVILSAGRASAASDGTAVQQRRASPNDWRVQTYFSQYYRRDVNQQNEQDQIVSQSALYSDVNFDARRRGERYDFSSRISIGYRSDFLDGADSDRSTRISYAYADLADAATGFRGRIGRQSRNTGGVLGRFDGLNLGYQLNERVLFNTVIGKPAYSSADEVDSSRTFYGASVNYGPILTNLDLGLFFIAQDIDSIQDRQAIGAEFRYFGENQSLWGKVDYDLAFGQLASAFLQGSWRFDSRLAVHALINRHGSPFLSTSNALIGQPVFSFSELATIFTEDELLELARDRSAMSTTLTVGLSYPLSPRLQVNFDASNSTLDATPASGGVLATEDSTYNYLSGSIVASSLLREGDVSIVSVRYSESDTSSVVSLAVDSRFPINRTWRINPRLRVDQRKRVGNPGNEWIYTPGIRVQFRKSQSFRLEFEAGKKFSEQDIESLAIDRESYFVNLGYQWFF